MASALIDSLLHDHMNPLPYGESVRYILKQHLIDLTQEFQSLVIKKQPYTYPDGRVLPLLMVEGTLPVYYQGVKYNLPIALWLTEQYPQKAPILYVVPTADMMVKPKHSFVEPAGRVHSAYLQNWSYSRSNLVLLCHDSAIEFGKEPPLFTKPPNYPVGPHVLPPVQPPQPHFHHPQELHNPLAVARPSGSLWDGALAAQGPRPALQSVPQPPSQPPPQPASPPATDLRAAFRKNAMAMLTTRLKTAVQKENDAATSEMDRLFEQQQELNGRQEKLASAVQSMQAERRALEEGGDELCKKAMALKRWLDENESRCPKGDIDIDAVIVASDPLSEQAISALAEDRAIDDLLTVLGKALEESRLPLDTYLRQVRIQSRKQFFKRVLAARVAAQQQVEVRRHYQPAPRANFANPLAGSRRER